MEDKQLVDGDPHPISTSEVQVSHTTKDQSRLKVSVASWGSGEPVPKNGRRTPPPKLPRLHRQLTIADKHRTEVHTTGPRDWEPMEAEPKGEKIGEVVVGWLVGIQARLLGGASARHKGAPPQAGQEQKSGSNHPSAGLPARRTYCCGSRAAAVFCLWGWGAWKYRHLGDLFSSCNFSTSPGGAA